MNMKNRKGIIGTGPKRVQKTLKILNCSAKNEHQKFQSYYRNGPKTGSKTPSKILKFSVKNEHQKFQSYYRNGPKTCSKPPQNYIILVLKMNLKIPKLL